MKLIALRGKENTGKSHVINIAYQFLLNEGWIQVPGNFRVLGNPIYDDIIDILEKDNALIGIIGAGDYQIGLMGLKNLIKELEDKNCDIVLCACRTNPKIEIAVTNFPNHTWIDKTISTGRDIDRIANNIDLRKIMNQIAQSKY